MTAHNDLDRKLNDFLRDGPNELPYESFDAVRDRTEMTGQRVVIGPWRLPDMNKIVTIGLGAAAVVLALVVGVQLFGSPSGGFGGPGDGPSATPDATGTLVPTPSPESSPTATPVAAPPLTGTFTSERHGISLSYPEGWTVKAATEPWTEPTFPLDVTGSHADVISDPTVSSDLFVIVASQSIGDEAPGDWVVRQMASEEGCPDTEPTSVDTGTGLLGTGDCTIAVVTSSGRGYWIQLYTSDDIPSAVATYDRAWFEALLATVQLSPEDAVDAEQSAAP